MGKVKPGAVIGALKDLLEKAKKSESIPVIEEALKTKKVVQRLKEKAEKGS